MICNVLSVLFFVLLLYLAVLYASTASFALLALLILALAVGILQLFFNFHSFHLSIPSVLPDTAGNGIGKCTLTAENRGFFSVSRVSLKLSLFDNRNCKVYQKKLTFSVPANKTILIPVEITSPCCGRFKIRIHHIRIFSLFSLLACPHPRQYAGEMIFYPEITPLCAAVSEKTRYFTAESEGFEEILPGSPQFPMNDIRSFMPGDKIRQIHWKLSARTDEILVRNAGQPEGFPVLLFFQLLQNQEKNAALQYSNFLEFAASISFSLLEKKCPHFVVWYDEKEQTPVRFPVRTEEEFNFFLYALFHAEIYTESKELYELYRQKYPTDTYCTRLLLHTNLTLFREDRELLTCNAGELQKQLEHFILTV